MNPSDLGSRILRAGMLYEGDARMAAMGEEAMRLCASQWRPIAEAPRDGIAFLGCVDGCVRIIQWGKTSHLPWHGFCLADQGSEDFDICEPTAWMPLPEPPK